MEEVLYHVEQETDDELSEAVRLVLRVGFSTLRVSETTEEAEFDKHVFDKMKHDYENRIDDHEDELAAWFDGQIES